MKREVDLLEEDGGSRVKVFHKGATIYKEGQESNVAYLVKQGRVSLYRIINNKRVFLGERGPGRIFGEMGIISGEKRSSNAEALGYTEVLLLDQALLRTMLLKSPRPVQIITAYLVDRVKTLASKITDRPTGNVFLGVCRVLALCHQAALATGAKAGPPELSYAEVCRTIKDILLMTQLEIDAVFERLGKLAVVEVSDVKGAHPRKDPLLGTVKKGPEFIRDRVIRVPDLDRFLQVSKNVARETRRENEFSCDLEFMDLDDFAREAECGPEMVYKKMGYKEIPPELFFFHKPTALAYIERMGPEFFKKARRPRLTAENLETVDDIISVDDATLQDVFSRLGFHKVAVLAAMAGDAARKKLFHNLSAKISEVVKEEVAGRTTWDEDEAADVEEELIAMIKTAKGLDR